MTIAIIARYDAYNSRRYSRPWVATVVNGKYDFATRVGYYTGNDHKGTGDAGDLIVIAPETDTIYAYGQKDHRGGNTQIGYALWIDNAFTPCDKAGRLIGDS